MKLHKGSIYHSLAVVSLRGGGSMMSFDVLERDLKQSRIPFPWKRFCDYNHAFPNMITIMMVVHFVILNVLARIEILYMNA